MLYTARCPKGHPDAEWQQLTSSAGAPYRYEITCRTCWSRPLATTAAQPTALPPAVPLSLRGYRWARRLVAQ